MAGLKRGPAKAILDEVCDAVKRWPRFAARAKLAGELTEKIRVAHQLDLAR